MRLKNALKKRWVVAGLILALVAATIAEVTLVADRLLNPPPEPPEIDLSSVSTTPTPPMPLRSVSADVLGATQGVAFSPDCSSILMVSTTGSIARWNIATGDTQILVHRTEYPSGYDGVTQTISPDGRFVLTGDESDRMGPANLSMDARLYDAGTGKLLHIIAGHLADSAAFSPDGRSLLINHSDGTTEMWDTATYRLNYRLDTGQDMTSAAFSPDGRSVLVGSEYGALHLREASTGRLLKTLSGYKSTPLGDMFSGSTTSYIVVSSAFSPDGRYAVTGNYDHTVRLWDLTTGKNTRVLNTGFTVVTSVAFSPDSKAVLVGGYSTAPDTVPDSPYAVYLWDVQNGQSLRTFGGTPDPVFGVAFSPDGKYVLAGTYGALLWSSGIGSANGPGSCPDYIRR